MHITIITVSYGETQSLPEYSNVKPNLTLTATLEDGDDPTEIEAQLWDWAKSSVREQIDQALEANDKAAKWSTEPRYQVVKTARDHYADRGRPDPPKLVVILPNALKVNRFGYGVSLVSAVYGETSNLRYAHALRVAHEAAERYDGAQILDCSDGDLTRLEAALAVAPAELIESLADDGHYEPEVDNEDEG